MLNQRSTTNAARFALNGVVFAATCLWGMQASALGLGRLQVTSALGETLRAEIDVTSLTPEEAASLRLRIASPEAYRAAGVEYNAVLPAAQVQLLRRPDGRQVLRVTSDRAVLEPFIDVIIEASWASGRLVREYTMLFDPPGSRAAAAPAAAPVVAPASPPVATAPAVPSAVPAPAPPVTAALPAAPAAPPPRVAPARPTPAEAPPPRAPVAAAAGAAGNAVHVRSGDTLSRIAGRVQRPGISLDQMLVSLYRGNPQAFVGDNMNRLKAGAVLAVPTAEQAARLTSPEAHEVIVAQSNDFAAYRQRLASGVSTVADQTPARQARGQVQTQVDDRRAAAAPTPDRLTLSQGAARASSPESRASRDAEKKDDSTRLAELARNVDELRRLQGATAPAAPAPAPATAATTAPPPPAPAAAVAPATPAPTGTASSPSVLPAVPAPAAVTPAMPASASAPAAPPPAARSTPPTPPPPAADEPGLLDRLSDGSLLWPLGGVLVALLAALGLYRMRSRSRKPMGETSFLESRLQPDSFFGASGGQRIDTRDASAGAASGNSSSMSYSLSQLDAIGDVDPVAEADVYLAYGRDLQAEEILKEAMRSTPERMAVRSKLLEVYAKRRDIKAFELLATQMFNLTRGDGEDWAKAQELGRTIDPDNVLYHPGGQPEEVRGAGGVVVPEPLGASTVPYTAPAQPPAFQPAADATLDGGIDLDLDLDLSHTAAAAPAPAPRRAAGAALSDAEMTQPITTRASSPAAGGLDLTLEDPADPYAGRRAPPPTTTSGAPLDFDLESFDDLDTRPPQLASREGEPTGADFGGFALDGGPHTAPAAPPTTISGQMDDSDALARKLDLAEEFRQIGDLEGARDLLEEVLAKSDGTLRAKAQGMLDKLG